MDRDRIENEYFEWLYSIACDGLIEDDRYTWYKLFKLLHDTEFIYSDPFDENRAVDGRYERWSFILAMEREKGYPREWWTDILPGKPCSVLEMMIRLAKDIENRIMSSTDYGDRTAQWFWEMIRNLGLGGMYDSAFDEEKAKRILDIFMKKEYEPDGRGGLFWIRSDYDRWNGADARDYEIWDQANAYFFRRV